MLMNHFANALIWLGGILNVLGLLGGLAFLVFWLLGFVQLEKGEHRCYKCEDAANCPAAYTGVAYPCAHYEKRK